MFFKKYLNISSKRFFHPGLPQNKKLALPICPENLKCKYYAPVWGNKVQDLQINQQNTYYNTTNINKSTHRISKIFKNETILLPTSHNSSIYTAIYSCRNLDNEKYINIIKKLKVVDENDVFINNLENIEKLLDVLHHVDSSTDKEILKSAFLGIISNFADSIYIANDYLSVSDNHVIISNYPNKVSQREIERSRIIAYNLLLGNYPIVLDNNINFEGEANIKFIPAIIELNKQQFQVCFTYESSRSTMDCISNLNKYLERIGQPLLMPIKLAPKKNLRNYFYHQDCLINFCSNDQYQYFNNYVFGVVGLEKSDKEMFTIIDYKYLSNLNDNFKSLKNTDIVVLQEQLYNSKNPIDIVTKINRIMFDNL